eukprot:Selendium_serpulae@DN6471_c0_g1_i1.p6
MTITKIVVLLLGAVVACSAEDLPSNAQLRIGVTHKPEECVKTAENGHKVAVHYTGKLRKDGSVFDSSVERGTPLEFVLGAGHVIKGWEQGILGMCVGEKRKLTIPSDLGYGDRGHGSIIPPKATLVFDVELMELKDAKAPATPTQAKESVGSPAEDDDSSDESDAAFDEL